MHGSQMFVSHSLHPPLFFSEIVSWMQIAVFLQHSWHHLPYLSEALGSYSVVTRNHRETILHRETGTIHSVSTQMRQRQEEQSQTKARSQFKKTWNNVVEGVVSATALQLNEADPVELGQSFEDISLPILCVLLGSAIPVAQLQLLQLQAHTAVSLTSELCQC